MTCLADITREFKRAKADSVWADRLHPPANVEHPCFGRVTAVLTVVEEPHFGGTSAAFRLDWTCSRCKNPYPARRLEIDAYVNAGEVDLDRLAELLHA